MLLLPWQDVVCSVFSGDDCCPGGSAEVVGVAVVLQVEVGEGAGEGSSSSLGGDVDV